MLEDDPAESYELAAHFPDDREEILELYHTEPIVCRMIELYAEEHDCRPEEVIHGSAGHPIHVGATKVLGSVESVERIRKVQQNLNEMLGVKEWRINLDDD